MTHFSQEERKKMVDGSAGERRYPFSTAAAEE